VVRAGGEALATDCRAAADPFCGANRTSTGRTRCSCTSTTTRDAIRSGSTTIWRTSRFDDGTIGWYDLTQHRRVGPAVDPGFPIDDFATRGKDPGSP
jgi:hypothetical protein